MTKSTDLLATGALLAQGKLDRYRELGAFGGPAWQSAVQMRAMLLRMNRKHCADYFARPNFDPEQKVLRWTAEVPGTAMAWDAMTPEQQAASALDLEVVRSDLRSLVQELGAKGGKQPGSAASFASLLEQAMQTPARGNFLYFVGKQPVIAFWGFENQENEIGELSQAPPRYPKGGGDGVIDALPGPGGPLPIAEETRRRRKPWWYLPLGLLGLLLLLALLLFTLRGCAPEVLPPFLAPAGQAQKETLDAQQRTQAGTAADSSRFGSDGSVRYDASGNVIRDGSVIGGAADGTATPSGEGASAPVPPAGEPGATMGEAAKDKQSDTPTEPRPEVAPGPDANDPKASKSADQQPNTQLPDVKPGDKNAAAPATDPPDLEIPKDPKAAQKMDFLQGQWKAGSGLVDTKDKQKVDMSFDIGKDGKGEVTYRKADGTVCKSPVQGTLTGAKVSIEGKDQVPCSGGGFFQAPRIECTRNSRGETDCSGVNADKSTFTTRVQKLP